MNTFTLNLTLTSKPISLFFMVGSFSSFFTFIFISEGLPFVLLWAGFGLMGAGFGLKDARFVITGFTLMGTLFECLNELLILDVIDGRCDLGDMLGGLSSKSSFSFTNKYLVLAWHEHTFKTSKIRSLIFRNAKQIFKTTYCWSKSKNIVYTNIGDILFVNQSFIVHLAALWIVDDLLQFKIWDIEIFIPLLIFLQKSCNDLFLFVESTSLTTTS